MKDKFTRDWIIENALEEIQNYEAGVLTLRALHYRLVSRGMTNTQNHYKRVIAAMTQARWDGLVPFHTFSDHERGMLGETASTPTIMKDEVESSKRTISYWMENYSLNRWENQQTHVEVWIEKKALQGTFEPMCKHHQVALAPCKGYPSLTFLHEAALRFNSVEDKEIVILYFGDYDPSGEDIPRSIGENLQKMYSGGITVQKVMLWESQVVEMELPPAPVKVGDSRSAKWSGLGQVELDAVEPYTLANICDNSIREYFNYELADELADREAEEKKQYQIELKKFINDL